jgi:putative spermidine/putrescine transport system permease protein/spermidine/putrescine transport system permease protein
MTALADPGLPTDADLRRSARQRTLLLLALAVPAGALIVALMVVPVGWLFWLSFVDPAGGLTLEHYQRIFTARTYLTSFTVTFQISLLVTLFCILLGYPAAYLLSELPARTATILMIAVMLPYWTSILVRTYAWLLLLQRSGLINEWGMASGLLSAPLALSHNLTGTLIGMTHVMLPFFILPVYAALRSIDRLYLTAASSLGAGPTRAFWTVFLPLSLPGLAAGSFLVFVLCIGFYVTPAVLGGGRVIMIAQQIERSISLYSNWGAASALGVVLLVVTVVVLGLAAAIGRLLFRRRA